MKPKHIKKETAKRLRMGFHTDLMDLIEESIDLYTEKTFMRGHDSFFEDASVHAGRIATDIKLYGGFGVDISIDSLAEIIENYFNSLKTE